MKIHADLPKIPMDPSGKLTKRVAVRVGFRTFLCCVKLSLYNYVYRRLHNIYILIYVEEFHWMTLLAIPKENTPQKFQVSVEYHVARVVTCLLYGFETKLLSLARVLKEHKLHQITNIEYP